MPDGSPLRGRAHRANELLSSISYFKIRAILSVTLLLMVLINVNGIDRSIERYEIVISARPS